MHVVRLHAPDGAQEEGLRSLVDAAFETKELATACWLLSTDLPAPHVPIAVLARVHMLAMEDFYRRLSRFHESKRGSGRA